VKTFKKSGRPLLRRTKKKKKQKILTKLSSKGTKNLSKQKKVKGKKVTFFGRKSGRTERKEKGGECEVLTEREKILTKRTRDLRLGEKKRHQNRGGRELQYLEREKVKNIVGVLGKLKKMVGKSSG